MTTVYLVTLHDILFSNVLKVVMMDNRAVAYCILHDMKYLSSYNIDNVVNVFTSWAKSVAEGGIQR